MVIDSIKSFFRWESAGGIMLVLATLLALIFANTPLVDAYNTFLNVPIEVRIARFDIDKPLLLWVNDGLMAIFFFLVGLELKRELIEGELSSPSKLILPTVAAVGGMVVPALIYVAFNAGDPLALRGWAIPAATDIAFALGVLSLLGSRVPTSLKVFLVSLAIIDDIGAIIIIALFYTSNLSFLSLSIAVICAVILFIMNRTRVNSLASYILVGTVMWASVLKSGVHATLAGVALAFFIPYITQEGRPLVKELENDLHPAVAFVILPLFAFVNAGVTLNGEVMSGLFSPIPMGIIAGLFFGKQIGIFLFSWGAVKLKLAPEPNMRWQELYGVAIICGVGFTMSLFISALSFEDGSMYLAIDRLGVLLGSFLSAIVGFICLYKVLPPAPKKNRKFSFLRKK